jgi:hypothetical protein
LFLQNYTKKEEEETEEAGSEYDSRQEESA